MHRSTKCCEPTGRCGDEQGFHSSGNVSFSASGTFTVVDLNFSAIYRGHHFHELSVTVYDAAGAVLGLAEVEFVMFRQVMHVSAGSLLAFGDSLSDMGNAKASLLNTPDEPPYWQGRFSNGEVWLGGLYDAYGLTSTIGSGLATSGANRLRRCADRFRLCLPRHTKCWYADHELFGKRAIHHSEQCCGEFVGGRKRFPLRFCKR